LNGRLEVNADENFYPEHNEIATIIHFSTSEGGFLSIDIDSNEQECEDVTAEGKHNERDYSILFSVQDNGTCGDDDGDDTWQWIVIAVVCAVVVAAISIGVGVFIVKKVRSV
jgi:hypothetical protein